MARFSVGGEADEGSCSQRRKRQRIDFPEAYYFPDPDHGNDQEHEKQSSEEDDDEEEESSSDEEQEDDEEENDEEEEALPIAERISSNAPVPVGPSRNSGICMTLTDPEVLDCPICYDTLSIPVFQCENGHTACSSCCKKVCNKCPSCSLPIGYNRCRAIEKVLESVKVPCQNQMYGCKEMLSYSKKFDHDKICNHAPFSCPISSCSFVGSDKQLYQHFSNKHKGSATKFRYGVTLHVFFTRTVKSLILQEEKEGVVFILNNREELLGNVITINCVGSSLNKGYFYELAARSEGSNLKFQSFTKGVSKVSNDNVSSKEFLLVPEGFLGSYGQISLDLCIWHYGACPASILSTDGAKSQRMNSLNSRMRLIDAVIP